MKTKQASFSAWITIILLFLANNAISRTVYFPHVASDGSWETEICVINADAVQSAFGTLRAFGDDGQEVGQGQSITLSPNGRYEVNVGQGFTEPQSIGYMTLETDAENLAGYTKFYIAGTYRVAVPAVSAVNTGNIHVPHIASDSNWWTGVALVNTNGAVRNVTFEFNDGTTATWTLPANGHDAFTISTLLGGQAPSAIESAVIKNGDGVVALSLFGSRAESDDNILSGVLLKGETASSLHYPHVASDGNWWTGVVAYNPNASMSQLTLTPYAADGTPLAAQTRMIDPFGRLVNTAAGLGLPAETAWFRIDATAPITGFELFGTTNGQQLAGYTGVNIAAQSGLFAKLETDGWTGIAFVNIEDDPAQVTLTAYDDSGNPVAKGSRTLGGFEKSVDEAWRFFDGAIAGATYIRYASDNNLVGFQLNGSSDDMLLDALPGMAAAASQTPTDELTYAVVDTGQTVCYDANGSQITCPAGGQSFYGQDANYTRNAPNYTVSNDGLTVYDNVTGLTWTQSPDLDGDGDIDVDDKLSLTEAKNYPNTLNAMNYGGYNDWRLPTMKALYSLMNFNGTDPSGPEASDSIPFIDTNYFDFGFGDTAAGERVIDAQFWSSNTYVGTVFGNQQATFGLNLADGRIKGYPSAGEMEKVNYVYFVRGNTAYGINNFTDNGDGTVTDSATGLMWSQNDSGTGLNWQEALAWVQQKNAENHLGYSDWRLPDAKEMQSILDYARSPDATDSAAVDPVFNITPITNEGGQIDYPWFWTGTTHLKSNGMGDAGVYICFGRALGYMNGSWMDVHGAGAQRSDPKMGDPADYPTGHGPQGDAIRIYNYVRLVRDAG